MTAIPGDLSIGPVTPASKAPAPAAAAAAAVLAAPAAPPVPSPLFPNPALRIDPALGIVVMEVKDASGKVEDSFPTARQLNAYRDGSLPVPLSSGGSAPPDPAGTGLATTA